MNKRISKQITNSSIRKESTDLNNRHYVSLQMLRAITLIIIFVAVKGDGCMRLSFGKNGNVCVCNSTYCDTIKVPQLQQDQFLWYTSTKDGKMMESSINNFSTENKAKNISKVLTLDSNKKYQPIFGFGGAMTDAAAINIRSLSNKTQQKLLESYFGSTGIGYTYCRIPIAGTDFSTRPYTYDDVPNDFTLSNFSLVKEDDYKIGYLHQIKNIMSDPEALRIFTTSWTAPAWMKSTNNIKWGALNHKYYQIYADYIKKFFDAYKERGINIWGMTPGNEPIDGLVPFFPFNSMLWLPGEEANWVANNLAPTLSKAGFKPIYMAMDDQRVLLPWYVDVMFKNRKAAEIFSGTAVHWYTDGQFSPDRLTRTHDKYPDKFILITEACTGTFTTNPFEPKVSLGSWKRGEQYILDIIENLSHWVNGWVDWNLALNKTGGPNWVENYVDSPIIVIPEEDQFYKQPMFYAIAHFSKFVPRNSYVIFSTLEEHLFEEKNIKSIAFLTPEQKIVIVNVNKGDNPIALTIKDIVRGKTISVTLPGKSFHTISYLA